MAKQKLINLWLFIPLIVFLLISLVALILNFTLVGEINIGTTILLFSLPLFLIFLSWNIIRLFKNRVLLWISVFVLPVLIVIINMVVIGLSNQGSAGGAETGLAIAINGLVFAIIGGTIALIGNIVIAIINTIKK